MTEPDLESDLEGEVVKWAQSEGGDAKKLVLYSETGWPDRTIFLPGGRIAIPELKRPKKNKRGHAQKIWVAWLKSLGVPTGFCETLDEVKELFE